jgi:hypothetical protein
MGDKHRLTGQKTRGIEINETTLTFSTIDSEISAAESQIVGESQTTISIPQTTQEPADHYLELRSY